METTMSQACPQPLRSVPAADAEAKVSQWYREHSGCVLGYVTRLLGDRYLAEDVVQETMLRAWRHSDELSPDNGSVRGWLIRVAHNIAMDKIRMRRSRPAEVEVHSMPEAVVQDHADAVLTALHVRHLLSRLSPRHRDVLEVLYLDDCTASEAAQRLGIPMGTTSSRLHHALRVLRRELGVVVPEPAPEAARRAA
jgi:RNA polymerase sigma-70 factor (ECF subfamily)